MWSCLLKGKANPESVAVDVSDGAEASPTIELRVGKAEGTSGRWGGFIESIEDSMQHLGGSIPNIGVKFGLAGGAVVSYRH